MRPPGVCGVVGPGQTDPSERSVTSLESSAVAGDSPLRVFSAARPVFLSSAGHE